MYCVRSFNHYRLMFSSALNIFIKYASIFQLYVIFNYCKNLNFIYAVKMPRPKRLLEMVE